MTSDEEIFKRALAAAKEHDLAGMALAEMVRRRWGDVDIFEDDRIAGPLSYGDGSISWAQFQKIVKSMK